MKLLTAAEVGRRLCLGTEVVRRLIRRGLIPAIRLGPRRIRVEETDLEAYIRQNKSSKQERETQKPSVSERVVRWALEFAWSNLADPEVEETLQERDLTVRDVAAELDAHGVEHAPNP